MGGKEALHRGLPLLGAVSRIRHAVGVWRELPPEEAVFVLRVGLISALVPGLMRGSLSGAVGSMGLPGTPLPVPMPERLVELVDRALAVDKGPFRPNCMRRTLVLARYLRRAGEEPVVCFGVKPDERPAGAFDGHAWIEIDGQPLAERADPHGLYTTMFRGEPRGVRARVFSQSEQVVRRVRSRLPRRPGVVLTAAHSGLWFGLLRARDLAEVDSLVYDRTYAYHQTDEHNDRGLFDWEEEALRAHFPASGRLLITSVGAGREALALEGRFAVSAFECNPKLRALAEKRLGDRVRPMRRDQCPRTGERFDGAIVGWASYTYLRGRQRRVAFLQDLAENLAPGAPVLLSFYVRTRETRRMRVIRGLGNAIGTPLGREAVELGDVLDPTFQHYVSEQELRSEVADAGFAVEAFATEPFAHAVLRLR